MSNMKFYKCYKCGKIVAVVKDVNVPTICCGEEMKELLPHENDSMMKEKHVPVYLVKKGKIVVKVGMIPHPSDDSHYIEWIALVTSKGNQRKCLKPGDAPKACFCLDEDEEVKEIYAYCNIHELWRLKVKEDDFINKRKFRHMNNM